MRVTKAVLTIALLILSIQASGLPPSDYLLELGDVKGESKVFVTTDIDCASGRLQFQVKGRPGASLTRMCQSRQTVPNLVIVKLGADGRPTGERQTLQNVTFTGCQNGDASIAADQFSLNYAGCGTATAGKQAEIRSSGILKPLAAATSPDQQASIPREIRSSGIISFSRPAVETPVEVESLVINGTRATLRLTKAGTGVLALSGAKTTIPVMTLKLANGQEWSFYEVTMEDLIVTSATGDRPTESLSLNFTKIVGLATGIQPAR